MYSFYGGRPGNSFIIVTTFRSVQDMIDAFKQGPNYTAVHYDEYVMINTVDKNDPDNGKIFRRGYNFTSVKLDVDGQPILDNQGQEIPTGGAQYIGTIAGPSGNAPKLHFTTISDVESRLLNNDQLIKKSESSGSYVPNSNNLIPGKTIDSNQNIVFNDEIKWKSCSIKDINNEDTIAYIGFQFPYPVFDFSAESINSNQNAWIEQVLEEDNNEQNYHPFYKNLKFHIPKGQKGDSINNLRIFEVTDTNKYDIYIDNNNYTENQREQDASAKRQILVYDSYSYEERNQGDKKTYYFGDYNMLKNLELDEQGLITAKYTHNNSEIINRFDFDNNKYIPIKWIKNIETTSSGLKVNYNIGDPDAVNFNYVSTVQFDKENQKLIFRDNTDQQVSQCVIKTITGIQSDNNGNIVISYNNSASDTIQNLIKQVEGITLNNNGQLFVKYSDSSSALSINSNNKIKWINNITSENNKITFNYNEGNGSDSIDIKSIDSIALNPNTGILTATYKIGNNNQNTDQLGTIKWVNNLRMDNEQNIWVDYNTGYSEQITNNPIKFIDSIEINSNNEILVKYSTDTNKTKVGTITTRAEYDVGGIYKNISWTGIGQISNPNGSVNSRTISFILPVIGSFSPNVKSITYDPNASNFGVVDVSDGTNSIIADIPIGSGTTVLKTFTGIYFSFSIPDQTNALPTSGTINISISGMNLKFSDLQQSQFLETYVPPQSSNR